MKWAFIDYENIGSLNKVDLSFYEKIIIFVGAKQKRSTLVTMFILSRLKLLTLK